MAFVTAIVAFLHSLKAYGRGVLQITKALRNFELRHRGEMVGSRPTAAPGFRAIKLPPDVSLLGAH